MRLHIDQFAKALRQLGHEAQIIDLLAPEGRPALNATMADPADCYAAVGGIGSLE